MQNSKQLAFARIEWSIAWRYLRARKSEGGVSAISLIALIGISLGVAAMIITFAVREGFRVEYIRTILGNQAHATIVPIQPALINGARVDGLADYQIYADSIMDIDGVQSATPLIKGQSGVRANGVMNFAEVRGYKPESFIQNKQLVANDRSFGDYTKFAEGEFVIALGQGLAWQLGVSIGDKVVLVVPGPNTAFGSMTREVGYEVVYIVDSGNNFVDSATVYLPFDMAQSLYDLEGVASQIDIRVDDAEEIEKYVGDVESKLQGKGFMSDWKTRNSGVLNGLKTEDNIMFILMSVLVLVSSFTIAAGLIMLVKNKTSDIAILRTIGFSRGRVMRIFFLAGVTLSILGTLVGLMIAALFCLFFDQIFIFVSMLLGGVGDAWAMQVVAQLDAVWNWGTVLKVCGLSLLISMIITILPASAAAKLDPAEGLRHG